MRGRVVFAVAVAVLVIAGSAAISSGHGGGGSRPAQPPLSPLPAHRPLVTALSYSGVEAPTPTDRELALKRVIDSGATSVRLTLSWRDLAPAKPPASFDARNPDDPAYNWASIDIQVKTIVAHGLVPVISIINAPAWALQAGSTIPVVRDLARFAAAAAKRYSGTFHGLPRVRYWQCWLEPNLTPLLDPQLVNGKPVAPIQYRSMVNAFADEVHAAASGNLVIAGGTAPFRDNTPRIIAQDADWGPLSFMRAMLCVSADGKPTCNTRVSFDIWAHHPYTSGGPTHHAYRPNDVSLADLPKLRALLDAAAAAGHIRSNGPVKLWVTEFSWDTSPPDPQGVPADLATRWVAHALYSMWTSGVTYVTWLELRDWPLDVRFEQAGLYYHGADLAADRPKPLLDAFRFPVVAFRRAKGVYVWGRTPASTAGTVVVQQQAGETWKTVGSLPTDRYGIFTSTFDLPAGGSVRARFRGVFSVPFSLRTVPDQFFNPFGTQDPLEPRTPKS